MQKKVVAVIIAIVIVGCCSFFGGVKSQSWKITQLTTELESVKSDKEILVATIKRKNLQDYFEIGRIPFELRMELLRPMTLDEKYLLY